jgi:A/G-specific adenine glycosylase
MVTDRQARFRSALLKWGQEHQRDFPWRERDRSFYEVFVAEFLLTQTPAENVATVYPRFVDQYLSLEDLRGASRDDLVDLIEPLGFYNIRADALKRIAAEHNRLPETTAELTDLPRVGDYVANATLCFARDEPLPILDRNVERIYRRVFDDQWPASRAEQREFASQLLPPDDARAYNLALLDFGASVCAPDPNCSICFASTYCEYYRDLD